MGFVIVLEKTNAAMMMKAINPMEPIARRCPSARMDEKRLGFVDLAHDHPIQISISKGEKEDNTGTPL